MFFFFSTKPCSQDLALIFTSLFTNFAHVHIVSVLSHYAFLFSYRDKYCAINVIYLKKTFVQYQTPTFCIRLASMLVGWRMRFNEGLLHVIHVYLLHSKYELGTRIRAAVLILNVKLTEYYNDIFFLQ